jgi:hypothetical protein
MQYTVVGVEWIKQERVLLHVSANNPIEAERLAYIKEPNLLIAGTFEDEIFPVVDRVGAHREFGLPQWVKEVSAREDERRLQSVGV